MLNAKGLDHFQRDLKKRFHNMIWLFHVLHANSITVRRLSYNMVQWPPLGLSEADYCTPWHDKRKIRIDYGDRRLWKRQKPVSRHDRKLHIHQISVRRKMTMCIAVYEAHVCMVIAKTYVHCPSTRVPGFTLFARTPLAHIRLPWLLLRTRLTARSWYTRCVHCLR